jgi:hypothetical protein
VIGLQALALVGAAVALLVATAVSKAHKLWIPLAEAGLLVLAAAVLWLCLRGLGGQRRSSRTPVVLLELLSLPVCFTQGVQGGHLTVCGPIFCSAVAVLAALAMPSARAQF